MLQVYANMQTQGQVRAPETAETVADNSNEKVQSKLTTKKFPKVRLYHLKYDVEGKVIDYHEDFFSVDANDLMKALSKVYPSGKPGAGKPVWVYSLPDDATKPESKVRCLHPECPATFISEEARLPHMLAQHREFYRMHLAKQDREEREKSIAKLEERLEEQRQQTNLLAEAVRQQGEMMARAMSTLAELLKEKKGGRS